MSDKGNDNLQRGPLDPKAAREAEWLARGLTPQPHGGAVAPPGPPGGRPENFEKARERENAIRAAARKDFGASLEIIAEDLTALTSALIRRHARNKEVPPRATMDALREFRQTLEAVNEARRARGAVAEAEGFFATLGSRLEEAAARMADGPQPAVEVPA